MRPLADIARLEEAHCAMTLHEIARSSMAIGGGYAAQGGGESWVNRAEGLGMSGPVSQDDVDRMVEWYAHAGMDAQIKVCPYADPSLPKHLTAAGFVVKRFEQLLHRELPRGERFIPPRLLPPDIEIRTVRRDDERRMRELAALMCKCFAAPGQEQMRDDEIELSMNCMRRERAVTIAAYHGDRCVGGGGMETLGDVTALYGAVVDPEYRRRGIQQALVAARLTEAISQGIPVATIGSDPGSGTERNVRRFGFQATYTKVVMVRPRAAFKPD